MASNTVDDSEESPQMSAEICRFAEFEIDRSAYELRRDGCPLKLERIPLDLLFLLIERRGRLVTREEILERIWGRVSSSMLTTPSIPHIAPPGDSTRRSIL
jgi:DNA-binding winged helix-turn-helix (wHTH) protein